MTQPLLDRSWLRRGLVSPSPTWGLSAPDLWLETQVTFQRNEMVRDAGGGFTTGGPGALAVTMMHVEIRIDDSQTLADPLTPVARRYYSLIGPVPVDPADMPRKGDVALFTDPAGKPVRALIRTVDMPEGIPDHIEVETDRWE